MAIATSRTRTFTWDDPADLAAAATRLDGLEFLRQVTDGKLPPPPIARLMDFTVDEVSPGRVVFGCEPAEWMFNPIGSVHGGVAATLLDSCMGCAIHTLLERGTGYTTTDLHVRYIRGLTLQTGRVRAEGTVLSHGRRQATAEGRLVAEETSKLLASATTACMVLTAPTGQRAAQDAAATADDGHASAQTRD